MTTEPRKIVTPEQYKRGWVELVGGGYFVRPYILIRQLPDGNYLVRNPEFQRLEAEREP